MSHYVVHVILPQDVEISEESEDLEFEVGKVLEPFDENKEVEPYEKPCYCVGSKAREERREKFNPLWQDLRETNKHLLMEKGIEDPWSYEAGVIWENIAKDLREKEDTFMKNHPNANDPDRTCDNCRGTGKYSSTYNPDSKWDWWMIGGRWDGSYKNYQISRNILSSNELVKGMKKYISLMEKYNWDKEKILFSELPEEQCLIKENDPYSFALCTPESNWFERGKMGWFAVVSCPTDDQKFYLGYMELLSRYPDHKVVVDLHI